MVMWLGVAGVTESLIPLEFETIEDARRFSEEISKRYMESEDKLFMAIEIDEIYKEL